MQTKPKSNSAVTSAFDAAANALVFTVRDGATVVGTATLRLGDVSEANRARATLHGFNQRIPDGAAISADIPPRDATPEVRAAMARARAEKKLAAMTRLCEHYNSGTEAWAIERANAGPGLDRTLLAAVAEATGKDLDAVRAMVAAGAAKREMKPGDYLASLGTAKAVAPILARMRAEAATIDADAELEAAMAGDEDAAGEGDDPADPDQNLATM